VAPQEQVSCEWTGESAFFGIWSDRVKLILITGGSQGLGEAMAIDFAKKGADIVLVSRSEEKLKVALEKVEVSML
jgi:short-subunit dehydrogenase